MRAFREKFRWAKGHTVRVSTPASDIVYDGCHFQEVLSGDPDIDELIEAATAVLRVYDECLSVLREEFEVEPAEVDEYEHLREVLKHGTV